jgi:hypothetical protein
MKKVCFKEYLSVDLAALINLVLFATKLHLEIKSYLKFVNQRKLFDIHSVSISSQTSNLVHYDQTNHRKIMKLIFNKAI